jgi:hypothetical protein
VALEQGGVQTIYQAWTYHMPTLTVLLRFQPPPARVLSIGCGLAMLDMLLVSHGYLVTSLDNDPEVLELAGQLGRRLGVTLDLQQGDAFDLKEHHDRYDLAFSAGLVEHWHGQHTVDLIAGHAHCAPRVQIEVPTPSSVVGASIDDIIEDAVFYRRREFTARVRRAGLTIEKVYAIGDVPNLQSKLLRNLMPPPAWYSLRLITGQSMGIGCVARRAST